jgi:hypothetical protein
LLHTCWLHANETTSTAYAILKPTPLKTVYAKNPFVILSRGWKHHTSTAYVSKNLTRK